MVFLHALSDFIDRTIAVSDLPPSYWYEGCCPQSGALLRLPRTALAEAIAAGLMRYLAANERYSCEGKMFGILLVETPAGERRVLKAFSGLLSGKPIVEGWVPPIPGRDRVAWEETLTLAILDSIKQELIVLQSLRERQDYEALSQDFARQLQALSVSHHQRKRERQQQRQAFLKTLSGDDLAIALEQLDEQSRRDGIERRQLKRKRDEVLQPLKQSLERADRRIRALKQRRKELSRQLQAQMHAAYSLTNFSGQSRSLQQLMPGGSLPTGTGDCCAPKLLHYAAVQGLKPLAMAEFWWSSSSGDRDKVRGEFYGACAERCQPLMGFLLSGLSGREAIAEILPYHSGDLTLPIVYEDEWLIAVNKPAGLLSVPGRYRDRQDSVLSRLRHLLPDGTRLMSVHRLDLETSGILLLARNEDTYRQLSQQFQQRQAYKVYEAILAGSVKTDRGAIELPLWGDPCDRPYQKVDWQYGKPSVTRFQVIAREGEYTRVEFMPVTGRTHQLRVHAADSRGLGVSILGDNLYGCRANATRLHLHARELRFEHPQLEKTVDLQTKTPF